MQIIIFMSNTIKKKPNETIETDEQREIRLKKQRDYRRKIKAIETDEQREIRLKKQRDYSRKFYITIETDEKREIRLKKQRDYSRKRYILKRKRVIENKKIANESFLIYCREYELKYLKERVKRLKGIKKQNVLERIKIIKKLKRIKKLKEVIN